MVFLMCEQFERYESKPHNYFLNGDKVKESYLSMNVEFTILPGRVCSLENCLAIDIFYYRRVHFFGFFGRLFNSN